ncbi:hypothetical protein KO493_03255 [Tamlana agarivorans]|uniref:Uncharacterized protein n=1 Tax=Pseudotamlana agarivorans TaxID=481183 RepID=A0ACC5U606_9FLAO|nr:hypothetical protein [Tamlana agarivorans]MBU2949711.1 hypothetical protein [Tamlana agarivorans]
MLRIVNFKERESDDGSTFFALTIQGGVELVKSNATGNFYATARKTSITSTFDEETCKALIGSQIPGKIVKRECEPYTFTIKETGEIIELSHRYEYISEAPSEREDMSDSTIDDFVLTESAQEKNHPLLAS